MRGIDPAVALGMEERRGQSFLIDDAARLLGVSRRTVYYRIREGRLVTIRCRAGSQRVLLSSIERLLREPVKAKSIK
jgi:excisionase family DNA binding protein